MRKSSKSNNRNKKILRNKSHKLFKGKKMKSKMKEMDMIKIEIKIKKTIGLKIKILKKMHKIKMKTNLREEVRKITITKMKLILKKNNKVIEGEINKIEMIIIENFKIEEEDKEEEKEEDKVEEKEEDKIEDMVEQKEEEKEGEREEEDIGQRMKLAMTHKYIKVLGNKIIMQEKMAKAVEVEGNQSIRKKEIEIQILK